VVRKILQSSHPWAQFAVFANGTKKLHHGSAVLVICIQYQNKTSVLLSIDFSNRGDCTRSTVRQNATTINNLITIVKICRVSP
jgi:hypothetical protein